MMVIMEEHQEKEQQNISHNSFWSCFSRIRSDELNDMGIWFKQNQPYPPLMGMPSKPQVIGHRIMHQHRHLEKEKMKLILNHF